MNKGFDFFSGPDRCDPTEPFRCPGSERKCISMQYLCDGAPDCDDGYDENIRLCTAGKYSPSMDNRITDSTCSTSREFNHTKNFEIGCAVSSVNE